MGIVVNDGRIEALGRGQEWGTGALGRDLATCVATGPFWQDERVN
jgi:hypothetical protein